MNKRIEEIRKSENLSRAAFGKELGVSGDVINNLERGRVEIKEHVIQLICMKFDVNETWLRTGEGEMRADDSREREIARFTKDLLLGEPDSFKNRLISALAKLSVEEWEVLEKIARNMADENTKKEE